jgi:hypothetical protein
LRQAFINVLDDENGTNEQAFELIVGFCETNGWQDILDLVEVQDDRYYLWEADAEKLRQRKI